NASIPVSKLPEELLVEVFSWLGPVVSTAGVASPWLPSAGACRRWREVICSNPQFWRKILVYKSVFWMTTSLARCRGVPVDIIFLAEHFPHRDLAVLLSDHVSSIRSLEFRHTLPEWAASISALLMAHTMPILERLT
ncbi:hypothetical protein L227DRAFT_490035, partial [Lentinus tigrinus ALCF2SS1-6]